MSTHHTYSFEKLEVYQAALNLSVNIRTLVEQFPTEEKYDLTRQIKRSADSIAACLAEGTGRSSNMDQAHFTNMAYATALETINHLILASKLEYISAEKYTALRMDLDKIINQLNALYKYQINAKQNLKTRTQKNQ